jgi:hypothetical protein
VSAALSAAAASAFLALALRQSRLCLLCVGSGCGLFAGLELLTKAALLCSAVVLPYLAVP